MTMSSSNGSPKRSRPLIGVSAFRRKPAQPLSAHTVGVPESYVKAIVAAGGIPLIIPVGLSEPDMLTLFEQIDGLLLPGGGDVAPRHYTDEPPHESLRGLDEQRDRLELFLARKAVKQLKPVLAICRGHQVLNVALGGTLWQDVESQMPGADKHEHPHGFPRNHIQHQLRVEQGTKLASVLKKERAADTSLHHQGIRQLAPELSATAFTPDGLIEGVEIVGHPFAVGVQWHPEDLIHDDVAMLALFQGLMMESARAHAGQKGCMYAIPPHS
jgi:putative glutamine amidotransferase